MIEIAYNEEKILALDKHTIKIQRTVDIYRCYTVTIDDVIIRNVWGWRIVNYHHQDCLFLVKIDGTLSVELSLNSGIMYFCWRKHQIQRYLPRIDRVDGRLQEVVE